MGARGADAARRPRPRERRACARSRRRRDGGRGRRCRARPSRIQLRRLRALPRGLDVHCERHQFTGLTRDGGFSEYVLVDERSLIRLSNGVDPAEVAPHADGITAYHAVKKLLPRLVPGSTTAVIGVGVSGTSGSSSSEFSEAGRSSGSTR